MDVLKFFQKYENNILDRLKALKFIQDIKRKSWENHLGKFSNTMGRGAVLEKVSISQMSITLKRDKREFTINVIDANIYPQSPLIPVAHFDIENRITDKRYLRGILDLLPAVPIEEDLNFVREKMRNLATINGKDYNRLREGLHNLYKMDHWERGLGAEVGMRFDSTEDEIEFIQNASEAIVDAYCKIVEKRKDEEPTEADYEVMFEKRARWVDYALFKDKAVETAVKDGVPIEWLTSTVMPPVLKYL